MALFDVERWIDDLQDLTFATEVAEVEWSEAVAIQHFYQQGICRHRNKISTEDEVALGNLRCKIESLMSHLKARNQTNSYFFVRLGPRSPKDAPVMVSEPAAVQATWCGISEKKLQAALQEATDRMSLWHIEKGEKRDACTVSRCFQDICYRLLRVTSAEEALGLLVTSSRVMQDISHTLDQGKDGWSMSVVAREWDDDVKLEREFRTFVVGGDITAISQYDDQLAYPFVSTPEHHQKIVSAIIHCLALARETLQHLSGNLGVVVDCVVIPSNDVASPWHARIIELNPFGPMTGASLFSWSGDRRLLQGGRDLYGDLDECERRTPAESIPVPRHVEEQRIQGVPFRYVAQNPPGFTWDKLEVLWSDYVRLAPPELLGVCSFEQSVV